MGCRPIGGGSISRAGFLRLAGGAALAPTLTSIGSSQGAMGAVMETRAIPATGEALPVIGCGTWRNFDVGASAADRAPLRGVLEALFAAGGAVIDSSPMYGAAEAAVGDLLAAMQARDKAFVATKVWTSGRESGIAQMERSMALLRTDRLDLMQVHNLVDWQTQLATLSGWKTEGRIRYLGITHYTPGAFDALEAVMRAEPVDFVQLNYAMDDRAAETRLLPLAAERGIAILVNRPFGGGGLLRRLRNRPLPAWAAEAGYRSWSALLLAFVIAQPAVTCVIPATSQTAHLRENLEAALLPLPDATLLARITAEVR